MRIDPSAATVTHGTVGANMMRGNDQLNAIDLFSGCGGLSEGLQSAGINVHQAYESWEPALSTYASNFSHHVDDKPLTEYTELPYADIIVGGPPCQGFSSAGRRDDNDERNTLIKVFSLLVSRHKPKAFIFENVEGFLTGGRGKYIIDLLDPLIAAGYNIHLRKVNAAHFGVPQHRKRVLVIGGLGWEPTFPDYTHAARGAPGATLANQHGWPMTPSMLDAFAGLPEAEVYSKNSAISNEFGHWYKPFNDGDQKRAALLKEGQRMRDLPEEYWHPSYKRRANRRVMDGTDTERRGGAPSGLRRLTGSEPSKAITSAAVREFVHPLFDRPLTVRECARLQTFPDNFVFRGKQAEQALMIGNAVPPRLAGILANQVKEDVLRCVSTDKQKGRLLSFSPTLSHAMSPALEKVTSLVRTRYQVNLDGQKKEQTELCL